MALPLVQSSSQTEMYDLAARVLVGTAALAALLLLASAAIGEWTGEVSRVLRQRAGFGAVLALAAALAQGLRRQRPRLAIAAVLVITTLAIWTQAVLAGIGLDAALLSTALFAAAVSGVLCSASVAIGFAAFNAVAGLLMAGAGRAGTQPGSASAADLGGRLAGHLVGVAVALAAALLLARLLRQGLARAQQHEQDLAALLRAGSDFTWEIDTRGFVTYVSPSFEARTGRSVNEFLQLARPGGPQIVDDEEWRLLREDFARQRAFRDRLITMRCTDGVEIAVLGHGDPRHDDEGRFIGWRGVSRNVTPERLAQRLQQRTQTLLDRLVQLNPDPICVARLTDGTILLANAEFKRLSGLSDEQVLGKSALELGLWRDPAVPKLLRDGLRRDGQLREMRTLVHLGENDARPMLLAATHFEWDGEPVAVIITRDVSAIERARAESDAILDQAHVGIALVRDRRFERVNPSFEAIYGRPPGSLAGAQTRVLFDNPDTQERFAERSDAILAAGDTVDREISATRPDGTRVLLHLRARAIEPGNLRTSGSIWVVEDITERRRAEAELASAKQQAEAASLAKSAFLATMSHEIRTPLNGVLGLARLMQDAALDEHRRREYLQHLIDAAEQLSGIVSDVLDLSKIEAGHLQIETIGFDLHELAHSTFATFAQLGLERGLAMRCEVDAQVIHRVRGDPVRVRQIVANYLGNALKFTQRGEVALQVRLGSAGRVRIEVRDTGPGIADEVREQLFKPFAQGDSSTTRRFGGTGLGLSICRELAGRMGGEVGVTSDGTSGSTFWAELLLPPDQRAATGAGEGEAPALPLAGLTVLVAEDNAVNRLIVGAMLRRLGAEVLEAEDGEQAVALVEAEARPPHLVLMDLHMPVLDGLQATRRLRATPRGARLPIYALSAAVLDQERQDAGDAGMNGFIAKPVIETELLRVLRGYVPASASSDIRPSD